MRRSSPIPEITPELEDAAFCEKLVDEYENDPEKDVSYTLEDCKKEWGLFIYYIVLGFAYGSRK